MNIRDDQPDDISGFLKWEGSRLRRSTELRRRVEKMISGQRPEELSIAGVLPLPEDLNRWLPENREELLPEKIRQIIHELRVNQIEMEVQKEELLESEAKYRRISEEMPSLICTFLPDSTLTYVNRAYCDYFKKHSDELTGKKFLDFMPEEDRRPLIQEYMSLTPANPVGSSEHSVVGADGRALRWHGWTNRAFFDERGEVLYFQAIGKDITDQRESEDTVRKARVAAEAATHSKSQFLASMSHEIRTPVNAVINMVRLVLDTPLNDEQKGYVQTAMTASRILLSLINDILDFSKIEAGKLGIENIEFKLISVLESVVRMLESRAEAKGLYLSYQIEPDVHSCLIGDPVRISQIMINLLNNAIKFTHKGGISIRVFLKNEHGSHCTVGFGITDTGIGICEDYKAMLFQPFSQLDSTTSRKYGGTGLGLAISRQLAELMGGEIGVESLDGVGSTFWFTVKLEKHVKTQFNDPYATKEYVLAQEFQSSNNCSEAAYVHGISDMLPDNGTPEPASARSDLTDAKILIAEDDILNQKVAMAILRKSGFSGDIATNGMEAVEALRKKRYDIVFMDMQMPVMDGIQATEIIRDRSSGVLNPDVAIIAMTANTATQDLQKCLDSGMNDYITKPVDPDKFLSIIRKLTMVDKTRFTSSPHSSQLSASSPVADSSSVCDFGAVQYRLGGDEKLAKHFITKWGSQSLSIEICNLKSALESRDQKMSGFLAHKIKGICANASADRLMEVIRQIESAITENMFDTASLLFKELEKQLAVFRSAVSERYPETLP